jgi:hypothetical protein
MEFEGNAQSAAPGGSCNALRGRRFCCMEVMAARGRKPRRSAHTPHGVPPRDDRGTKVWLKGSPARH